MRIPPRTRISREKIVDAAIEVIRRCGFENINAETVSDQLHTEYLMNIPPGQDPILGIRLNYIRFAVKEPQLFRFLFQSGYAEGNRLMEMVGSAEELIFRGFLFKAMLKDGKIKSAVIVSSVTFGLGHIINLLTGHDLVPTLIQVIFAIAVGFILTMALYKCGSLLPNILMHSLVDVFSLFANGDGPQWLDGVTHAAIIVLSITYCLYLVKRVGTPTTDKTMPKRPIG